MFGWTWDSLAGVGVRSDMNTLTMPASSFSAFWVAVELRDGLLMPWLTIDGLAVY